MKKLFLHRIHHLERVQFHPSQRLNSSVHLQHMCLMILSLHWSLIEARDPDYEHEVALVV